MSEPVTVTPGHPVKTGAGYDCCCGECLFRRAQAEPDFSEYDVVTYDTGTQYIVFGPSAGRLFVKGFRNGKPFGALRYIAADRCTKIGVAIRPHTSRDNWKFEPTN